MAEFKRVTNQTLYLDQQTQIQYWVVGNSLNPALMLIAGFGGTHGDLLPMTDLLRKKYFLIIPDLPGWGKSQDFRGGLTIENYAFYLKGLIDQLGIKKLNIFGHCMGAVVTLEFCYQFPDIVRKAVLASTPFLDGTIIKRFYIFLAEASLHSPKRFRPIFFFWRLRFFEASISLFSLKFHSFKKRIRWIKSILINRSKQKEITVEDNWLSFIKSNFDRYKGVKVPILLIHGSDDLIVSPNRAKKLSTKLSAPLQFIEGAGHIPPSESPHILQKMIENFLDS